MPARLAVVHEQDVDVAVRGQLLAAVAADGDEGDRGLAAAACTTCAGGAGEEADEQLVGGVGQRPAELPTADGVVGDQLRRAARLPSRPSAKGTGSALASIVVKCPFAARSAARPAVGIVALAIVARLRRRRHRDADEPGDGRHHDHRCPHGSTTACCASACSCPDSGEGATIGQPLIDAASRAADLDQRRRRRARRAGRDRRRLRRGQQRGDRPRRHRLADRARRRRRRRAGVVDDRAGHARRAAHGRAS